MGRYLENEEEKRMNYLRRKLLQWKDKTKYSRKEVAQNKIAKWAAEKYKKKLLQEIIGKKYSINMICL